MPFKSEAQRRFMWANHPEMAKEWQAETPKGKKLPKKLGKTKEARLGPVVESALGGGLLGAAGGGLLGYAVPLAGAPIQKDPSTQAHADRMYSAKVMALGGGLTGGLLGFRHGVNRQMWDDAFRYSDPFKGRDPFRDVNWDDVFSRAGRGRYRGGGAASPRRPRVSGPPSWMGNVKTKAEAKAKYREAAIKNHPDKGGSNEAMGAINSEWDNFKASPHFDKLAFAAFLDEMTKIADLAGLVLSQMARREVTPPVTQAIGDVEESIAEKWRRFSSQDLLDQ